MHGSGTKDLYGELGCKGTKLPKGWTLEGRRGTGSSRSCLGEIGHSTLSSPGRTGIGERKNVKF